MASKQGSWLVLMWVMCSVVFSSAGCTTAPAVNRVQPNAQLKSAFDGEWYYLQTVIDTPYSAGYTFVGEQGPLEKVVWEIQEEFLIARRSYEHIAGSEPEGIAASTERGAAVAMYEIQSHFDIRRQYNPTTGEELNVVEENDTDRPWYERDYFRIDWSENLITNNEFLVLARIFDGIEVEPVSYYVQDLGQDHPHQPKFESPAPGEPVNYIDIVNKIFVRPTTVTIDGFGEVPSCYLLYQGHLDCAPGEITVRNSFLQVDSSRDYEPQLFTGDRMERFGYFVTERAGYDAQYGVVEPARYRFANRHNLWTESHRRDPSGELIRCTASTEAGPAPVCAPAGSATGSVCDLDLARAERRHNAAGELEGACTIPYRERGVRQIAYHLSRGFPADLEPDAQHLVDQWNGAFVETVASLRENECVAATGDVGACASERSRPDAQAIHVLCHSPVAVDDAASCGDEGTIAEIGDLRHSLIGWVAEPHASSPLGYGPSAADPTTGEIIMGNAFVYGAALETLATFARDLVALLNRDTSEAAVSSGALVRDWVERMDAPGAAVTGRTADDHVVPIDGVNVGRVAEAMHFDWVGDLGMSARGIARRPSSVREFMELSAASLDTLDRNGAFGVGSGRGAARLQNLVGTDIERLMTGPEMRIAAGVDPFLPVNDGILDMASPLRGRSAQQILALQRARDRVQLHACILGAEFADDGLLGLAREIQRATTTGGTMSWYGQTYEIVGASGALDYEAIRTMLRHPIFDAVTSHEVGHTVGLRHNFSGSYDSLNFHPRYWELRDDGFMAPRAWDPMTQAEIDGRIQEYQYSSVMDYGNNFVVGDAQGIGHYDVAAIKMGYGDLVEVFDGAASANDLNWMQFITRQGWPVPLKLSSFTGGTVAAYQYTDIPGLIGGRARLEQRSDVAYESLVPDSFLSSQGISDPLMDPTGRPTVPYLFCSDEQADLGPDCQRYDRGADAYEALQSVIDTYWNYYIFNAFRRGRIGFNAESYANRILSRYFVKLQYANQIYTLFRPIIQDVFAGEPSLDTFFTRQDGMGAWTAGVGAGYELLLRAITTPEPGNYARTTLPDGTEAFTTASGGFGGMRVDALDGRNIETTWDFDAGYFWFDQLERAGFYFDKVMALEVLMDPETRFLGRDTAADVRRYQINYYSPFAPSLTSFLRGVLAEDWQTIGPRLRAGAVVYPDALNLERMDMTGVPIDPSASFSIQLYAAAYGMSMIPETFDPGFFNRSRIFVLGGAEGVTIAAGHPVVRFTDPDSGLTYVAASYMSAGNETGVGAQMLNHAHALTASGTAADVRRYIDNIDVVRRLSWLLAY